MATKLESQINKLKAEIEGWPKEQKGSFVGGICEGLLIGVLAAGTSGREIAENTAIKELMDFLGHHSWPVKRRQSPQQPKPSRDQLCDDIKALLQRAISCHLRIPKEAFDTSLDVEDKVDSILTTVIAIANRKSLDDAIQDIQVVRSIMGGGVVHRETVKSEVESCHENFSKEIAAVEQFNDMSKRNAFKPKDIWISLRSILVVDYGYQDEALQEIDTRYQ